MQKSAYQKNSVLLLFFLLVFLLLTRSAICVQFARTGLKLWFDNMIPVLLPFMILSGTLIRMNLSEGFVLLIYPVINKAFRISKNACYVMIMGFLCGFPMGARCIGELYACGRISRKEATLLLAFCNNIGPVYLIGFALPLLKFSDLGVVLVGMYGIPLVYGLFLRYTLYAGEDCRENFSGDAVPPKGLFVNLNEAIASSVQSMLMLGGYMILFNLLMILPAMVSEQLLHFTAPLLEITGGLMIMQEHYRLPALCCLQFGGFSCIAQTYHCIQDTDLSILEYTVHKLVLTLLTALFYSIYFLRLRFFLV